MNKAYWIVIGGVWGLLGVALGAFGAHGLQRIAAGDEALGWWRTAVLYHLVHVPMLVMLPMLPLRRPSADVVGWAFLLGTFVFSGTLYAMALGGPRWLGAVTPLGGIGMLLGWFLLSLSGVRAWSDSADAPPK